MLDMTLLGVKPCFVVRLCRLENNFMYSVTPLEQLVKSSALQKQNEFFKATYRNSYFMLSILSGQYVHLLCLIVFNVNHSRHLVNVSFFSSLTFHLINNQKFQDSFGSPYYKQSPPKCCKLDPGSHLLHHHVEWCPVVVHHKTPL